jgi:2-iminobutanoate/2-iminopropanoate deaminase
MTRTAIKTTHAPGAVAAYSQAIDTGQIVFLAGQIGLDPDTGTIVEGGIDAQSERVMQNLTAVLEAAGLTFEDVAKTTCFLSDIANFDAFNKVYATYMPDPPPARSTFAVAALPRGALIEVEAIAARR